MDTVFCLLVYAFQGLICKISGIQSALICGRPYRWIANGESAKDESAFLGWSNFFWRKWMRSHYKMEQL